MVAVGDTPREGFDSPNGNSGSNPDPATKHC